MNQQITIKQKPYEREWPPRFKSKVRTHFEYRCLTCGHVWEGKRDSATSDHSAIFIPIICPRCRTSLRSKRGGKVEVRDLVHDLPSFIPGTTLPYKVAKDDELLPEKLLPRKPPTPEEMELFEPTDVDENAQQEPPRKRGRPKGSGKSTKSTDNVKNSEKALEAYLLI